MTTQRPSERNIAQSQFIILGLRNSYKPFAGNSTGLVAGVAGAVVGASAGASLANATGSSITFGTTAGALTGAIVSSSIGNPFATVAMGLAGATAPVGMGVGVAGMLSV